MTTKLWAILAGAVGLFCAGLLVGWCLYRPDARLPESHAPASVQADGSDILEREATTADPGKAPHIIPKGATEERRVQVVVQGQKGVVIREPHATTDSSAPGANSVGSLEKSLENSRENLPTGTVDSCLCPPVTVDLSLVRMPDNSRRVIASSPSGKILSGLDVPISAPGDSPARRPWAAGISFSADRRFGGFLDRDLGPFRVGVEAFQSPNGWTAQARAGIRF